MAKIQLSSDPFARTTLHRETVDAPDKSCDWCGRGRRNGQLFWYSTGDSAGRSDAHKGLFCSKPCHDSYHG